MDTNPDQAATAHGGGSGRRQDILELARHGGDVRPGPNAAKISLPEPAPAPPEPPKPKQP